jgi:hypothetical protein
MFMTPVGAGASPAAATWMPRVAGVLCLAATVALTIVPGWFLSRI